MGRPARNHGGTGGHGCQPLPGERPDFNRHVVSDKTLQKMVKNANQEPAGRSTKLDTLKYLPKYDEKPKRAHSDGRSILIDRPVDSVSMEVPKVGHCDSPRLMEPKMVQGDTPSNKKQKGGPCDTPSTKKPKAVHCDTPNNKEPMVGDCDTPNGPVTMENSGRDDGDEPGDSVSINESKMAHIDSPIDTLSIKESQGAHWGSSRGCININNPKRVNSEGPCDNISEPRFAHSGRQHDSSKDSKLAQIQSEPSTPVGSTRQSNQKTTVVSEQLSFPPMGMLLSSTGVPAFTEKVNRFTNC